MLIHALRRFICERGITGTGAAYKGPAVVAANGSRPAIALIDDQNIWSAMFRWQRNFYP